MRFLSSTWGEIEWTSWLPFPNSSAFKTLPPSPGMYRIRAINGNELFYLGETGRNLRERLRDLRRNTMAELMPYNDPHTAAPSLWAWRHAEGLEFECSAAPVTLTDDQEEARKHREGLEFYLLWQYRLEFGSSTRCNHGRFHSRYMKSTDRKKGLGLQGYRLPDNAPNNPAGGPSLPSLQLIATPFESHWMGLSWSPSNHLIKTNLNNIPASPGVYKIFDGKQRELLYIGETGNLRQRLRTHEQKLWECTTPLFSYVKLPEDTPVYQRHEIENDLIGGYFAQTKRIPKFQLIDHK
jgi:hypothetical protein